MGTRSGCCGHPEQATATSAEGAMPHGPVPQGAISRLDAGEALPLRRIRPRCLLLFLPLSHQRQIPQGLEAEQP